MATKSTATKRTKRTSTRGSAAHRERSGRVTAATDGAARGKGHGGGGEVDPARAQRDAAMAGFFAAAKRLYKARPWNLMDADEDLLVELDAPALGWPAACVWILDGRDSSPGFVVFPTVEDFHAMCREVEAQVLGEPYARPSAAEFTVTFEPLAAFPPAARREIARHGWPAARAGVYPLLDVTDAAGLERGEPALADVAFAWAACEALARYVEAHRRDWDAVLASAEPVRERYAIEGLPSASGATAVAVATPHPAQIAPPSAEGAWLDEYLEAHAATPGPDDSALGLIEHMAEVLVDAIANSGAPPLAEWTADDVATLLLEYCPRYVDLEDAEVERAPAALAHWLAWLGATGRLHHGAALAAQCEALAPRFVAALRDPSHASPMQRLVDTLRAMGFDVADLDQIDTGVAAFNAQLHSELAAAAPLHAPPPPRGFVALVGTVVGGRWVPAPGAPVPAASAPCPCRSGKTYGRCCGAPQRARGRATS